MIGRPRFLRPRWGNGRLADEAIVEAGRALTLGGLAADRVGELETELDEARRDVKYAREARDKALRQVDAFALEVDQLKARLAEVETERDVTMADLVVLAKRNVDLRRAVESSPERVRQACLDLSDEVFALRRKNAELQRGAAPSGAVAP